jgi:hypothetical protein
MIGEKEFAMMRDGVYFINNARAAIVDEKALREAIYSRKVAGAALDVFHNEPIRVNDPFLKMDNIVVTPHIAGAGLEVIFRHSNMLCDDLFVLLKGEMPKALLNPEAIGDLSRFKQLGSSISTAVGSRIECSGCSQSKESNEINSDIVSKITEEVLKQIKARIDK